MLQFKWTKQSLYHVFINKTYTVGSQEVSLLSSTDREVEKTGDEVTCAHSSHNKKSHNWTCPSMAFQQNGVIQRAAEKDFSCGADTG